MTPLRHPALIAGLVVLLILTAQSIAVARAAPGPAGQMVLCGGSGVVVVPVDADGEPMEAPHPCPDCAMSLWAGWPAVRATDGPLVLPAVFSIDRFVRWPVLGAARWGRARGPPAAA